MIKLKLKKHKMHAVHMQKKEEEEIPEQLHI